MLVLVSFVLVLAAAVTLVVGLLQSGLTLIYLSIGCSVLAGLVLMVAVLRGRPEPKAASSGRAYSPPPQPAQVPASVGAPSTEADTTSAWSTSAPAAPPTPPPPAPYTPAPTSGAGDATQAAGAALLGRLRGKRGEKSEPAPVESESTSEPVPVSGAVPMGDATTEMTAISPEEDGDGFPIAGYDRLRATELLSQLPGLDRNQLEAVREREANGKNRFTIMSRVDALLATTQEPAWEVDDDEWEAEAAATPEPEVMVAHAATDAGDEYDDEDFVEDDVVAGRLHAEEAEQEEDAVMATGAAFPIASYETLTVGQILPRLSELGPDELTQVRTREEMGRARGTILDRIDRLATRRAPTGGLAMPAAPPASPPARRAPVRRAPAASRATAPTVKKAVRAPARRVAAPAPEVTVVPPATRTPAARKAAPGQAIPAPRKARAPKAAAPVIPVPPGTTPMKEAVKKARATKQAKRA